MLMVLVCIVKLQKCGLQTFMGAARFCCAAVHGAPDSAANCCLWRVPTIVDSHLQMPVACAVLCGERQGVCLYGVLFL